LTLTRRQFSTATAGVAGAAVLAQTMSSASADTAEPDPAELAKAGPAGDVSLGSDKAPVTIIEYASMTCPHCAHFSTTTFPELQKRYDKFMPIVETLFAKQPEWMVQKPVPPLMEIAKQFGFTQASFDACLANQQVLDGIQGKKLVGDQSIDALAKAIDPYLKEG
jgi:protein-disulfide isomerase